MLLGWKQTLLIGCSLGQFAACTEPLAPRYPERPHQLAPTGINNSSSQSLATGNFGWNSSSLVTPGSTHFTSIASSSEGNVYATYSRSIRSSLTTEIGPSGSTSNESDGATRTLPLSGPAPNFHSPSSSAKQSKSQSYADMQSAEASQVLSKPMAIDPLPTAASRGAMSDRSAGPQSSFLRTGTLPPANTSTAAFNLSDSLPLDTCPEMRAVLNYTSVPVPPAADHSSHGYAQSCNAAWQQYTLASSSWWSLVGVRSTLKLNISLSTKTRELGNVVEPTVLADGFTRMKGKPKAPGAWIPTRIETITFEGGPSSSVSTSFFSACLQAANGVNSSQSVRFPNQTPSCSILPRQCSQLEQIEHRHPASSAICGSRAYRHSGCQIYASKVNVLYWPHVTDKPQTNISGPVTAVIGTETLYSPSIYLYLNQVGIRHTWWTDHSFSSTEKTLNGAMHTFMPLPPESLYSVVYTVPGCQGLCPESLSSIFNTKMPYGAKLGVTKQRYDPATVNHNDPVPASAYFWGKVDAGDNLGRTPLNWIYYMPYEQVIWDNYLPQIAAPRELRELDPDWWSCDLGVGGIYDPPYALQPGVLHYTPTLTPGGGPLPSPDPPLPGGSTPSLPQITSSPNSAQTTALPSSSTTSALPGFDFPINPVNLSSQPGIISSLSTSGSISNDPGAPLGPTDSAVDIGSLNAPTAVDVGAVSTSWPGTTSAASSIALDDSPPDSTPATATRTTILNVFGESAANAALISGTTVVDGGPAATVDGNVFSMASDKLFLNSAAATTFPIPTATISSVPIASSVILTGADGSTTPALAVHGHTVTAGGAPMIYAGHTYSVDQQGNPVTNTLPHSPLDSKTPLTVTQLGDTAANLNPTSTLAQPTSFASPVTATVGTHVIVLATNGGLIVDNSPLLTPGPSPTAPAPPDTAVQIAELTLTSGTVHTATRTTVRNAAGRETPVVLFGTRTASIGQVLDVEGSAVAVGSQGVALGRTVALFHSTATQDAAPPATIAAPLGAAADAARSPSAVSSTSTSDAPAVQALSAVYLVVVLVLSILR